MWIRQLQFQIQVQVQATASTSGPLPLEIDTLPSLPNTYHHFEPLVVSSPNRDAVRTTEEDALRSMEMVAYINDVLTNVADEKLKIKQEKSAFLEEVRGCVKEKSDKYMSKLKITKDKLTHKIAQLRHQRKALDALITSLVSEEDQVNKGIDNVIYFKTMSGLCLVRN